MRNLFFRITPLIQCASFRRYRGNRAYDHELIWKDLTNTNKSLGFNVEWQVNDSWALSFNTHSSTAEVIGGELNNSIGFTTVIQANITHTNGGSS